MLSIVHGAEVQFRHESAFRERERAVLAAIREREAAVLAGARERGAVVAGVRDHAAVLAATATPAKAPRQRGPWARPIGVVSCTEAACAVA